MTKFMYIKYMYLKIYTKYQIISLQEERKKWRRGNSESYLFLF